MAIRINNKELLVGIQHMIAGHEIKKIFVNGTQVWQYDNTPPTLALTSPYTGEIISANARTFSIRGSVSDAASGINKVTVNGTQVTITNGVFTYTAANSGGNYTIKAYDNAGNVRTKTVRIYRQNYNDVDSGSNTPSPGDTTYEEWSRCNVCGKYETERKWRSNGEHQSGGTVFRQCPNGPHYKYTISIT